MLRKIIASVFLILILFIQEKNRPCHLIRLSLDKNFTKNEVSLILGAAWRWKLAANGLIDFDITLEEDMSDFSPWEELDIQRDRVRIWKTYNSDLRLREFEDQTGLEVLGFTGKSYIFLVFDRFESEDDFQNIMIHEIGHLLAISHTKSIMIAGNQRTDGEKQCISDVDLYLLCKKINCNISDLNSECESLDSQQ